jgi:hypothetical protein
MKNLPAFPVSEEETDRIDEGVKIYSGLTKREYFAAKAMQGIMGNNVTEPTQQVHFDNIAEDSVRAADAMLKALRIES